MAVTAAVDFGGWGRLGQMKIAKRAEGREERRLGIAEKSAAQNLRLGGLQIKQMEGNLQSIKYKGELTQDLQKVLANVPEGKNRYVAGQSYLMSMAIDDSNPAKAKIAYDLSQEARENQGNIIDDMAKLDEEGAITAYNESIGEFDRHKLTYHSTNKAGKIFEAVSDKTGESVFVQNTDKGLVELKGFKPKSVKEEGYLLPDSEVEFLARKYIVDSVKPYPVRGKEANAKNAQVIGRATEILVSEGKSGGEQSYDVQERKNIQKSLAGQEKKRGSMIGFVENLGQQVDRVKENADELKSFDVRIFNKPAVWVKKHMVGSPGFAKYELYIGEIQSEIGKLSSNATDSVAELSEGAREKWENVLDINLSMKDMIEVLEEVKHAGKMRMDSVDFGIKETKKRLRNVGKNDKKTMPANELSDKALLEMLNAN